MAIDCVTHPWGKLLSQGLTTRKLALVSVIYPGKKENKILLIYKEIQKGAVAKSYMTNGLLIYD